MTMQQHLFPPKPSKIITPLDPKEQGDKIQNVTLTEIDEHIADRPRRHPRNRLLDANDPSGV